MPPEQERVGAPQQGPTVGVVLDGLALAAATGFAAILLWTLPGFLGLAAGPGLAGAWALGLLVGFGATGPWRARIGWRLLAAAIALAAIVATVLAMRVGQGLGTAGTLAMWAQGSLPRLAGPADWLVGATSGAVVGAAVFAAARARRPVIVLAGGLSLLSVEWEFVDGAVTPLFWPLAVIGLIWLALAHARGVLRDAPADDEYAAGLPLGAALGAGAVILILLVAVPRNGGPANLGALGRWINRLPVIGTLEQSTREGALGSPGTATGGPTPGDGPGGNLPANEQDSFDIAQVGFGPGASTLGGPAHPGSGTDLEVYVAPGSQAPRVLYLRGAVYDLYNGRGWARSSLAATVDPYWPQQSAGSLGASFMTGRALPAPFMDVNLRITPLGATANNVFTLLTPLRVSAPGLFWDTAGDAWSLSKTTTTYAVTSAVLPQRSYLEDGLASYLLPSGTRVTPALAALAPNGIVSSGTERAASVRDLGGGNLASDTETPPELPPEVRALALAWTQGVWGHPLLEALAIAHHLQTSYPYTLNAPAPPAGQDFVDFFLFHARTGYCTYYSTAMAVMLRSIGVPTRWVEGFRVPVPAGGGVIAVKDAWAHAWVEAYIPPYGWLTFDPTPSAASAGTPPPPPTTRTARTPPPPRPWWLLWLAAGTGAAATIGWGFSNLWSERRALDDPANGPAVIWRACERVGARWGRRRDRAETPAEYAEALAAAFPALAPAARALAAEYGRLCFGPPDPRAHADAFARLRAQWLRLQRDWRELGTIAYAARRWL